jgi:DNA-directed RNA polymerase specialized sigma subunit
MSGLSVLSGASDVIRCLVTYTDWWQPSSSSLYRIVGTGDRSHGDGMRGGLLDHLDERSELCRRMTELDDRDRHLLVLWYVKELQVEEIAPLLGISRRQCFRRRAQAIRKLIDLGEPPRAA